MGPIYFVYRWYKKHRKVRKFVRGAAMITGIWF